MCAAQPRMVFPFFLLALHRLAQPRLTCKQSLWMRRALLIPVGCEFNVLHSAPQHVHGHLLVIACPMAPHTAAAGADAIALAHTAGMVQS